MRYQLSEAVKQGDRLGSLLGTSLPEGPVSPALREQLSSAFMAASFASKASRDAAAGVEALKAHVRIPGGLSEAIWAVSIMQDPLTRGEGYLRGIVDAGVVPPVKNAYMFDQIRLDAREIASRAKVALAELDKTGWKGPVPGGPVTPPA